MGYDPNLGRFATRDPVAYADGMNAYQALRGNPIRFVDPDGLLSLLAGGPYDPYVGAVDLGMAIFNGGLVAADQIIGPHLPDWLGGGGPDPFGPGFGGFADDDPCDNQCEAYLIGSPVQDGGFGFTHLAIEFVDADGNRGVIELRTPNDYADDPVATGGGGGVAGVIGTVRGTPRWGMHIYDESQGPSATPFPSQTDPNWGHQISIPGADPCAALDALREAAAGVAAGAGGKPYFTSLNNSNTFVGDVFEGTGATAPLPFRPSINGFGGSW